ncbi:hypothetical protein AB8O64_19730 [Streptomyces sp. QH1-20]|uniref:phage tail protein n=1 Tax=Streptomyces sp. QH1-20 TaxID=3240934 RepID=UPI0035166936
MALTIGELTGFIDLDDSGAQQGVAGTEAALASLQRGADGRLRDLRGRFVAEAAQIGAALGDGIGDGVAAGASRAEGSLDGVAGALDEVGDSANRAEGGVGGVGATLRDEVADGAERAGGKFTGLAKALVGLGAGAPAVAAVGVAVGGLAAAGAAAGAGVKAFSAAAKPQLESVTSAYDLYTAAQDAASEGGEKAAEAQQAYAAALADMPPATRATAKSFIGLKEDVKDWSDSLSSTTMPVFTKGIELLRDLLPALTPFVKGAATAFSGFLDEVRAGVESAPFKRFAADMGEASGPALSGFLSAVKNIVVGIAGILAAFMPMSAGMSGGLADLTAKFAAFGQGLKGSAGFERFLDFARTGATTLGNLGAAVLKLIVALAPLLGTTALLINAFAELVSAIPIPVLTILATVLTTVGVGLKAYALGQAIVSTATRAWATAQAAFNAVMAANPIVLVVGLLALLAVGLVLAYQKSETFRQIVQGAWAGIQAAASTAWQWIKGAYDGIVSGAGAVIGWLGANWPMLLAILTGPIGIAVGLIVKYWDEIQAAFVAAWQGVRETGDAAMTWVSGLPGRTVAALSTLGSRLWNSAVSGFRRFRDGQVETALAAVDWMRSLPGRLSGAVGDLGSLLVDKGRDVVRGLWRGIQGMGSWLRSTLSSWARDLIPGPIARALGIASPSRVMARDVGRWIPAGLVRGIESGQGAVDRTMRDLVTPPTPPAMPQLGAAGAYGGAAPFGVGAAAGPAVHIEHWHGGEQSPEQTAVALAWHMKQRG